MTLGMNYLTLSLKQQRYILYLLIPYKYVLGDFKKRFWSQDSLENQVEDEMASDQTENVPIDPRALDNPASELKKIVKDAFHGLQTSKVDRNPKSAVGIYSQIMSEKLKESSKIELEKLKQSQLQFGEDIKVQNERNRIELLKVFILEIC